jgi:CubicO group peptidase (beta-lactamase class C family)
MKSFTKALDILKEAVDARRIPGANVLVFKNGKEVCYLEDGYADIENEIPIERDTIFRLFSMTKPITGAAAMILFQNGQIDLHEPISNYLEGFSHQVVTGQDILEQVKQEATIFNLLSMTSGLQYDIPEVAAVFDEAALRGLSTIEVAERLGRCPLAFHPG